jgi:hypothetical protein
MQSLKVKVAFVKQLPVMVVLNNKRLTITWGGGGGVDPFLSPFLLLAGDGGGAGLGVVGGGT